ncbi:hypothetical protein OUZ56_012340 [Daphnia magna]|uniref:Uncharacterized protein n=1 Tax=Daphnia magna TaxID=35525 RepID=A0ABQ9Z407_9CRUS|nr:hypothetical protein OUZ56_012340 [Daphnia magna]
MAYALIYCARNKTKSGHQTMKPYIPFSPSLFKAKPQQLLPATAASPSKKVVTNATFPADNTL